MQKLSDEDIITKLKSTKYTENDEAVKFMYYAMYRKVSGFIKKNSGSEQDADDAFQDGLVALYKAAKNDRLEGIQNIEAYFFSICRNLWLKALKKAQRTTSLTDEHNTLSEEAIQVSTLLSEEKSTALNRLLEGLGESCHKVLVYYYYDRFKMKEIMKLMNFSSDQVAKNKKSACMKKLKNLIAENPGLEDLLK